MPCAGGPGSKDPTSGESDFVVVANRLPVDMERLPDGSTNWKRSPGGLVTALEPILRRRHGAWIGWPGIVDDDVDVEDVERGLVSGRDLFPQVVCDVLAVVHLGDLDAGLAQALEHLDL